MNGKSKLQGKVSLITGASKGIGAGIAKRYAEEGAAVVVNYSSSKEGADKVVAEIVADGGGAIAVQGNVANAADVTKIFEAVKTHFGKLDILVNNAGIHSFAGIEDITQESFHSMFDTNVLGESCRSSRRLSCLATAAGRLSTWVRSFPHWTCLRRWCIPLPNTPWTR